MKSILTFLCLLIGQFAAAQDYTRLEQILQQSTVLNKHYYGVSLYDLDSARFVLDHQADKHFTPASNTKVFTLFASLKLIGDSIPGLAYVERGDSLIFWGTGDPTFLHVKLDNGRVFQFLKNSNKKLYYSKSKPQETVYRNGWSMEDYEFYYQPEITPFPIYGNVVQFRERGKKLRMFPSYFESQAQLLADTVTKYRIHRPLVNNHFEVNTFPLPANYINEKPFKTSDSLLVRLLQDTLQKTVGLIDEPLPADAKVYYSTPTREVLREMMLPSDNFLAEQLNMIASFMKYRKFQTEELRNYMKTTYYNLFQDKIDLMDGSGLSTYNKITPRSMVELLLMVTNVVRDDAAKHYLFPAGGLEGTLKGVYSTPGGVPFVWAKTGTINSVHCQSGFIKTRTGKRYAFSFLNNNYLGSSSPVRKEMVKFVTYIYENF